MESMSITKEIDGTVTELFKETGIKMLSLFHRFIEILKTENIPQNEITAALRNNVYNYPDGSILRLNRQL